MIAARGRPITIACRRSNVRVAYTVCERRVGCGKLSANVLCCTEFLRQSRKWFSWFWLNDKDGAYTIFFNRRSGYGTFFYRGTENCKAGGIVGRYAARVYAVCSEASRRRCYVVHCFSTFVRPRPCKFFFL